MTATDTRTYTDVCTVHGIARCTICAPEAEYETPSLTGFVRRTAPCMFCGLTIEAGRQAYVTSIYARNLYTVACAGHNL
jgi:hypothetical protein